MVDVGLTVDLRIARIPPGAGDPDELIERDLERWQSVLAASIPAFEFYFDTVVRMVDRDSDGWRQQVIDRIMPVIQEFPFALGMQAAWIERLSDITGIQSRLLQSRLSAGTQPISGRRATAPQRDAPPTKALPLPRQVNLRAEAERALTQVLLNCPLPSDLVDAVSDVHPADPDLADLLALIVSQAGSGRRPNITNVKPRVQHLAEELIHAPLDDLSDSRITPAIRIHLATIRLLDVKRRLDDLQALFPELTDEDRPALRKQRDLLLGERSDLEKQMLDLQQKVVAGV
jgi:DNA primase